MWCNLIRRVRRTSGCSQGRRFKRFESILCAAQPTKDVATCNLISALSVQHHTGTLALTASDLQYRVCKKKEAWLYGKFSCAAHVEYDLALLRPKRKRGRDDAHRQGYPCSPGDHAHVRPLGGGLLPCAPVMSKCVGRGAGLRLTMPP